MEFVIGLALGGGIGFLAGYIKWGRNSSGSNVSTGGGSSKGNSDPKRN